MLAVSRRGTSSSSPSASLSPSDGACADDNTVWAMVDTILYLFSSTRDANQLTLAKAKRPAPSVLSARIPPIGGQPTHIVDSRH
jgi:hypothetical protein